MENTSSVSPQHSKLMRTHCNIKYYVALQSNKSVSESDNFTDPIENCCCEYRTGWKYKEMSAKAYLWRPHVCWICPHQWCPLPPLGYTQTAQCNPEERAQSEPALFCLFWSKPTKHTSLAVDIHLDIWNPVLVFMHREIGFRHCERETGLLK